MLYDKVIDGKLIEAGRGSPRLTGIGNPTREQLAAAGWYPQSRDPSQAPDGQYLSGWRWRALEKGLSMYQPIYSVIPAAVDPGSTVEDRLAAVESGLAATKAVADKAAADVKALQVKEVPK
jgi:hypothetical protein